MAKRFPFYKQHDAMDCGAACLRMVARYYNRFYALDYLRELTYLDKEGVSLRGISDGAENLGFHTLAASISFDQLVSEIPMPCIAHWQKDHFVVIYKVTQKQVVIADPASGIHKISKDEFMEGWAGRGESGTDGVVLILEPTPDFFKKEGEKNSGWGLSSVLSYFWRFPQLLAQLGIGLLLGSVLQIIFPFLVQAIVDFGISKQDYNFIWIVLLAQVMLHISYAAVELIRSWILMHIGTRVNISLVSDFLMKLMRLPLRFFDSKLTGDLLQRIADNQRVERFLTSNSLMAFLSIINFIVFGIVLLVYNAYVFLLFLLGTAVYFLWAFLFSKKRRELDFKRFDYQSENQSKIVQLIDGIQDIKLHNAEMAMRWDWERTQAKLFRIKLKYLRLDQWQRAGSTLINEVKNVLIAFLAASAVIDDQITLGMMLAILYIIGQLNAPVEQLLRFVQAAQDARISLERMNEIHASIEPVSEESKLNILPTNGNLLMENVSFQYSGPYAPLVLRNINLFFPEGKSTAIVGASGSGKTTLIKLLLNYYPPTEGQIKFGDFNLGRVPQALWRERCGVVMQDNYIFSDTIAHNIALGEEVIDKNRLVEAATVANMVNFVDTLPQGFNTKVGKDGVGLSQGQKQRLLIARAVYKNPDYIFFDEATNALDAYNEMIIMDNLNDFFESRTVIIVAHRLSTIKKADNIVVLGEGEIIEQGTHEQLIQEKGAYYHLVKNQLELGV